VRPPLLAFLAALLVALSLTAAASARDPRLEQLKLRPVDMDLAANAILRPADIGNWARIPGKSGDDAAPDCPGQDYSAFTITGQAQSHFQKQGASVLSRVEVYPSSKQVLGDFAVDARPGTAACEGRVLRREVAKEAKGLAVTLASAKQIRGPKVGQRSIAFKIVLRLEGPSGTLKLYIDLIGFVRDRAAASVVLIAPGQPFPGGTALARLIDSRLQRVA
jgi:hypothetical protein